MSALTKNRRRRVALSVVEGEKPLVGQSVTFAFINPFSEHRDEAAEYLADAWALELKEDMIMLSPEMNEPVLNSYYEENLQNIDNSIADLQKTLDKTEDEETRESLQANLDSMKQWREDYEKSGKYQISPEQIGELPRVRREHGRAAEPHLEHERGLDAGAAVSRRRDERPAAGGGAGKDPANAEAGGQLNPHV